MGNATFVLASLLSWSASKRENRKPLRKEAGVLFLSLGPANKIQSLFSFWRITDKKLIHKISSKDSSGPCSQSVPSNSESHRAGGVPSSPPTRVTISKERSILRSEPSGPCQRKSFLNAVSSRSLSSPCLMSPLLVIPSQFWTACLDSCALSSMSPLKAWEETFRKHDWGQLCCTPAKPLEPPFSMIDSDCCGSRNSIMVSKDG